MVAGQRYSQRLDQALTILETALPPDAALPATHGAFRALSPHAIEVMNVAAHTSHAGERSITQVALCGVAMLHASDHQASIDLNQLVLAQRVEQLGDTHSDTLSSRSNLAASYESAGRTDDAIELQEVVLAQCIEQLGDTHPHTLGSRNNLARMRDERASRLG